MQTLSTHHVRNAALHQAAACQNIRPGRRAPVRTVTQAGLFGLNFGTASKQDIEARKQEVCDYQDEQIACACCCSLLITLCMLPLHWLQHSAVTDC